MSILSALRSPRATLARVSTRALTVAGFATLALGLASVTYARETHQVSQKGRAFNIKEISIAAGDLVQFLNDDEFIHQIFIQSKTFNFDSAESEPGNHIDVIFPAAGNYEVRCHIHPKMHLLVTVQ